MGISFFNQKSKGGGDGSSMNIFTQLEEPSVKNGIWLQTDKEMEHIYGDDDVVESESWYPDGTFRNIPYSFSYGSVVTIGTDIYLLGGGSNNGAYNYKYDTLTDTYTQLTNIPYNFYNGSAVNIGTDIYLFGSSKSGYGNYSYKYDTLTDTYTQLTNIPYSSSSRVAAVSIETDIYLFYRYSSTNKLACKYNTLTDAYTQITDIPYIFYNGSAVNIGTNIYLLGSEINSNNNYKYDTLTDTYTQLTNIPFGFFGGSATSIGTDIYLFGSGNSSYYTRAYKYDTLTDTYTQLTNIPYNFYNGSAVTVNFKIYLFGGSGYPTKVQCMQAQTKTYEDNSVIISQGRLYNVGYATEVFSNSLAEISLLYAFADAWFYTEEEGLITNIPTYYGNGTEWIKIKN